MYCGAGDLFHKSFVIRVEKRSFHTVASSCCLRSFKKAIHPEGVNLSKTHIFLGWKWDQTHCCEVYESVNSSYSLLLDRMDETGYECCNMGTCFTEAENDKAFETILQSKTKMDHPNTHTQPLHMRPCGVFLLLPLYKLLRVQQSIFKLLSFWSILLFRHPICFHTFTSTLKYALGH